MRRIDVSLLQMYLSIKCLMLVNNYLHILSELCSEDQWRPRGNVRWTSLTEGRMRMLVSP